MTEFPQLSGFRGSAGIVRLIGHRGARGIMPENTLEGFEFALRMNVKALEFDVVLTRDMIPVITHNHRLAKSATRMSDGFWLSGEEPKVSSLSYAELQAFDVGGLDGHSTYGQRFPDQAFLNGVRVPRLADLLALVTQPRNADVHLLLELKSDPDLKDNIPERRRLVEAVIEDVRTHRLTLRTVLHSFDWDLLSECRRQAPEMPTSYLSELPESCDEAGEESSRSLGPDFTAMSGSVPLSVKKAGGQMWCPHFRDVTPHLVAEAHSLGVLVSTWTVNARADIENMIDAGVDGIISDYPGRVQRCLLNKKRRWKE